MSLGTPLFGTNASGQINGSLGDSYGPVFYVDTENGSSRANGKSQKNAFATMAQAFEALETMQALKAGSSSNATIYVIGHIAEQVESPQNVFGVKIIGLVGGRPRNTTDSGIVLDGNGVDWVAPSSPTADEPLLRISEQGWEVHNILFVPGNGIAGIELRREETATYFDPSHSIIKGCRFTAANTTNTVGIEDIGGCFNVLVEDCTFFTLASGILNTSTSIALPLMWTIRNNRFEDNTEHIDTPLSKGLFAGNVMDEATVNIDFDGGAGNFVTNNVFSNAAADITVSDGYTGGTGDVWAQNFATDQAVFGAPV